MGKKVIFLPQCHSTNEEAQTLLSNEGAEEGTCVITHHQLKGKGQRGNKWESEPGKNITFSLVLKPTFLSPSEQFNLHIITSLCIYDVLFELLGKRLKIKWPNDIYFNNNKIGGILIENALRGKRIESSIIGIGINVNQIEFLNHHASSIKEITHETHEINGLIEKIIIALEKRYLELKQGELCTLRKLYGRRLYLLGSLSKFRTINHCFDGTITGIDHTGKLKINEDENEQLFNFKEIEFVRP